MTVSKDADKLAGYKGLHVEGSRKGKVHKLFDAQGAEAAWTLGMKLKLKEGTLRSWFAAWRRRDDKGKVKVKAKPKAAAKPAPVAATAVEPAPAVA